MFIFIIHTRAIVEGFKSHPRCGICSCDGRNRIGAAEVAPRWASRPAKGRALRPTDNAGREWNPNQRAGPAKTACSERGSAEGTRGTPAHDSRGSSTYLPPVPAPSAPSLSVEPALPV